MRESEHSSDWDDFDTGEYAWRCYGKVMDIDRMLITETIRTLKKMRIEPASFQYAADVGTGPNLFPAMLLAPLIAPKEQGGRLDLVEYGRPNLQYLRDVVAGQPTSPPATIWEKYESLMAGLSPVWQRAWQHLNGIVQIEEGSIFALRPSTYDAVSAFFVAESITDSMSECKQAVKCLLDSVKPGGIVIVGHMLGSTGYPAGVDTFFPSVALTLEDLHTMYDEELDDLTVIAPPLTHEVHKNYHGSAVIVGRRSYKTGARGGKNGGDVVHKPFTSYDTQACLYDEKRVAFFRQALFETVRPGDVVVDAGSGSGVLGLLAVQAGASKVYCIELNEEYAEIIRRNAESNGMQDSIVVLQDDACTVALPEQVDVVISEVISAGFFDEPQLQIMHNMRRFLKPGGRTVPASMENYIELIDAQDELYGLTFNYDTRFKALHDNALTTKCKYLETNFLQESPFIINAKPVVRSTSTGRANAFRIGYAIRFSESVLGVEPTDFLLNPQVIFLPEKVWLRRGAYYEVALQYEASSSPLACRVEVREAQRHRGLT